MLLEEFDEKDKPILTPEVFITKDDNCPKIAVGFFANKVEEKFVEVFNPEVYKTLLAGFPIKLYRIPEKDDMIFFHCPIGGSACAMLMEEMIALGVKHFLMSGTCGVLKNNISSYTLIVPDKAIRDEGTSYHYCPASDYVDINPKIFTKITKYLEDNGVEFIKGTTWTTDGIYRETAKKTDNRKNMGAICVDMECATMCALTQSKNIDFGQIFYSADVVCEDEYDARIMIKDDMEVEEKILRLVIDCAEKIYK